MIKLINGSAVKPRLWYKVMSPAILCVTFPPKTDTASWKLTHSDLSVLDNFVPAHLCHAGNVLFFSSGSSFVFYVSLFSPWWGCAGCNVSVIQCPCSAPWTGAQGHPGGPAAFSLLEKEVAHGGNTFEKHLGLEMFHSGAGSWRLPGSSSADGSASGQ